MCVFSVSQSCLTLGDAVDYSPRLLCPWNCPGKNTGMGSHFLLEGILLTQGLNPCLLPLLNWQADSLPLCPQGIIKNWTQLSGLLLLELCRIALTGRRFSVNFAVHTCIHSCLIPPAWGLYIPHLHVVEIGSYLGPQTLSVGSGMPLIHFWEWEHWDQPYSLLGFFFFWGDGMKVRSQGSSRTPLSQEIFLHHLQVSAQLHTAL